jgi:hypothetical protein
MPRPVKQRYLYKKNIFYEYLFYEKRLLFGCNSKNEESVSPESAAMEKDKDIKDNRAIEKLATRLVEQVRDACINGKKESVNSLSDLGIDKKQAK